jgi:hypothetical protein
MNKPTRGGRGYDSDRVKFVETTRWLPEEPALEITHGLEFGGEDISLQYRQLRLVTSI